MKRFLYLDCDGVLNGCTNIDDFMVYWHSEKSCLRGDPFNMYKVALLAKLVIEYDIEVIGISSWFGGRDTEKVLQELRECEEFSLPIHRVSKCTTGGVGRCQAVLDDVMEHRPDFWCILDDGERSYIRTKHPIYDEQPYFDVRGKLVAPRGRYGINEEHIEQIGMLLNITNENYTSAYPLGMIQDQLTYNPKLGGVENLDMETAILLQKRKLS